MDKLFKQLKLVIVVSVLFLVSILGVGCNSTSQNGNDDGTIPKITVLEQTNSTNLNLYVNKNTFSSFTIPVILDVDVSMFNTGTSTSNNKLYVKDVIGENIDDLKITGIQRDCFRGAENSNNKYVCTFDFSIEANSTWVSKQEERKITQISFQILDSVITCPVQIYIHENSEPAKYVYDCPILKNMDYKVLVNSSTSQKFGLALNWDIAGWGGLSWEDDFYATIVGFRFDNELYDLTSFTIIKDNDEGISIPEQKISFDLNNVNYALTSRQCYWGGNFVDFTVTLKDSSKHCISDSFIMQYTINGGSTVYEVNLATIQIYNLMN